MQVEVNETMKSAIDKEFNKSVIGNGLIITPAIGEDYWWARVHLFKDQYILAFPKFFTVGIGFAKEEDWNTNLPYKCTAEEITKHIWHNHKYEEITKEQVLEAIKLLQPVAAKLDIWSKNEPSK